MSKKEILTRKLKLSKANTDEFHSTTTSCLYLPSIKSYLLTVVIINTPESKHRWECEGFRVFF
jgi:hypothetical protein